MTTHSDSDLSARAACRTSGRRKKYQTLLLAGWCALLGSVLSTPAIAQVIPPTATPGAVEPSLKPQEIPKAPAAEIAIPPLRERPLGVDEGPKIAVKRFILEGVIERPDYISAQQVETIAENGRRRYPDGLTMGQMQLIANEITNYYRSHGLILALAYVGQQTVDKGEVKISVLEGNFGEVKLEGNKRYTQEVMDRPFAELKGMPVTKDGLEAALLEAMGYPGLTASGVLKPGEAVGTTDLYLKVDEDLFSGQATGDNAGSRYTGEYRARIDFAINNPTKAADRLTMTFLDAFEPDNTLYGSIFYERPLPFSHTSFGVGYHENAFEVGKELEDFDIAGKTKTWTTYIKRDFIKSRKANLDGAIIFDNIRSTRTRLKVLEALDHLSVFRGAMHMGSIDNLGGGGINDVEFVASNGVADFLGSMDSDPENSSRVGNSGRHAGSDFFKFNIKTFRLQRLFKNVSALMRIESQYSDALLVSAEQFYLGGPNSVRAYPQAEFLRDKGYFASLEFIFNAPGFADQPAFFNKKWGEILQFTLFADTAGGSINDPLPSEESTAYISGAGIGMRFILPSQFRAELNVAKPMAKHDPSDKREYRTNFNIAYIF